MRMRLSWFLASTAMMLGLTLLPGFAQSSEGDTQDKEAIAKNAEA